MTIVEWVLHPGLGITLRHYQEAGAQCLRRACSSAEGKQVNSSGARAVDESVWQSGLRMRQPVRMGPLWPKRVIRERGPWVCGCWEVVSAAMGSADNAGFVVVAVTLPALAALRLDRAHVQERLCKSACYTVGS